MTRVVGLKDSNTETRIALIAALAENRVIGMGNRLPWHLPADLAHFRALTLGKPIVMGRRTFESLGRPLPGRTNIVITGSPTFPAPGCIRVHSVEQALTAAGQVPEVMIIGGAALYAQMLPRADRLYLTLVHGVFPGDVSFPEVDPHLWSQVEREDQDADERNPWPYSFITLVRL